MPSAPFTDVLVDSNNSAAVALATGDTYDPTGQVTTVRSPAFRVDDNMLADSTHVFIDGSISDDGRRDVTIYILRAHFDGSPHNYDRTFTSDGVEHVTTKLDGHFTCDPNRQKGCVYGESVGMSVTEAELGDVAELDPCRE